MKNRSTILKLKLAVSFMLLFLAASFVTRKPNADENKIQDIAVTNTNISDSFLIGAMNNGLDTSYKLISDSLGLNLWHLYIGMGMRSNGSFETRGWDWWNYVPDSSHSSDDSLLAPLGAFQTIVINRLNSNHNKHMKTIMHRPKIEYLCFGQRSDYQCEKVPLNQDLWFYTFNVSKDNIYIDDITDNTSFGNGVKVKYCAGNPANALARADTIVKRLKANAEQANTEGNGPAQDVIHNWFVKPRIRIDSNEVDNNPNRKVCRIDVYNYNGDSSDINKIKSVDIYVRNFDSAGTFNYNGKYLEEYFFDASPNIQSAIIINGSNPFNDSNAFNPDGKKWGYKSRGEHTIDNGDWCKVDFQVYWYGECDMYIDYVRVDNGIANDLLTTSTTNQTHQLYENFLQWEGQLAVHNSSLKFYIELSEFNHIPCIAYVSNKLKEYTNQSGKNVNMMTDLTNMYSVHVPWSDRTRLEDAGHIERNYIDKIGATQIFMESYPMTACYTSNPVEQNFSMIPNTLPVTSGNGVLAQAIPPAQYDSLLQENLDYKPYQLEGDDLTLPKCNVGNTDLNQDRGNFRYRMQLGNKISKLAGIPFIFMQQAHLWYRSGEVRREPTNEELNLLSNLAVSYGAKGIIYFNYDSENALTNTTTYSRGLVEPNFTPRDSNVYGQKKWNAMKKIVKRLKKWDSYVMSFDTSTNSYICRLERTDLIDNTYFNDVLSYKPDPAIITNPSSTAEPVAQRYLQVAKFNNPNEQNTRYFMIVNRRCSPYNSTNPSIENGGRFIKIKLDSNSQPFLGFNNWKIINVENDSLIKIFDKRTLATIDLGWYLPGEGKLYKIAPVMQEGGTLIADESFGGVNFNCKDTVISTGKNITITGPTTTINFRDSATIILNNANFYCGQFNTGQFITFKGIGNGKWKGLNLNKSHVKIYNSKFQDIASPVVNYAVKMLNCPLGDIRDNQFIMNSDTAGGINSSYLTGKVSNFNLYINYNTFIMNNSRASTIKVQGFSGITLPLYVQHNTMTSNGYATGIMLSSITGGVIGYNNLTGFSTGMNVMFTDADFYSNTISNTSNSSTGILASSGSLINLSDIYIDEVIAGSNTITNTSSNSKNINVQGASFLLHFGYNTFNVASSSPIQNYHLHGIFPGGGYYSTYAQQNCFKINGTVITSPTLPINAVYTGGTPSTLINFNFIPYNCSRGEPDGYQIVDIGNGLYDTLPIFGGGGYGEGGKNNYPLREASELRIKNYELKETNEKQDQNSITEITTSSRNIYDSICIQMRFRNYVSVKGLCYELINNYPDSLESISSLSKLYLSELNTDTSTQGSTDLKSFYENLILNNSQNEEMVSTCNYLIQKCKVRLGLYQSALDGFQQIIDENPYSYEGLLARWDFSATSLLDSMDGSGGGKKDLEFGTSDLEFENNKKELTNDFSLTNNDDRMRNMIKKYLLKSKEKQ